MSRDGVDVRFSPRLFAGLSPRESPQEDGGGGGGGGGRARSPPMLPPPAPALAPPAGRAALLSPIAATFVRASRGLAGVAPALALRGDARKVTSPSGPPALWEPTGVRLADLPDAAQHPPTVHAVSGAHLPTPGRPQLGVRVTVGGGVDVALFRYRGAPVAVAALCPHQRGELHLGDIEALGDRVCVTCPRHHFMFDVTTGDCAQPAGRPEFKLGVFHAREDEAGLVEVGFSRLAESAFGGGGM